MAAAAVDAKSATHIVFDTSAGSIRIKLRRDVAPQTCETLCKLVAGGNYNGCCIYRAEPNFVVQGGLRKADGSGVAKSPFGGIPLEYSLPNKRGTVTLARWADTKSGDSEWFINLKDNANLDRTGDSGWALGFAVWGEVDAASLTVAEAISKLPTAVKGGLKMLVEPVAFKAATLA